mmetsp:Transcript_31989/g.78485  ORF Transcript_31989/g.78485 Transcript_31989/m.78485 type:complete len:215 (+) Transcript_31989:587-1231(+)
MMSAKTTFPWQLHGTSDLSMWKGVEFDLPPKSPGSSEYGPVWHFFAFFKKERSPLKKGHDIVCLVPWPNGQPCGREFQRPKDGSTSALFKHLKTKHPSKHNEIQQLSMRSATAKLKQNADIAQALKMGGTQSEGAGSAEATSTDSGASSGRGSGSAEKKMLAHVPSIFGAVFLDVDVPGPERVRAKNRGHDGHGAGFAPNSARAAARTQAFKAA